MTTNRAGFRDAIHVPYIMVTCDADLQPGDKCSLRHDNKCVKWEGRADEPMWHGVAEPFRETSIPAGEVFAVFIRSDCFSKMRHDFTIEVHDRGGTESCHAVCDIF